MAYDEKRKIIGEIQRGLYNAASKNDVKGVHNIMDALVAKDQELAWEYARKFINTVEKKYPPEYYEMKKQLDAQFGVKAKVSKMTSYVMDRYNEKKEKAIVQNPNIKDLIDNDDDNN